MGGILGTVGGWLFGKGASGVVSLAKGVDDIVDRHVATVENKEAFTKDVFSLVQQETATAQGFAAPGVHNTTFDALVDGINRLIRPWIAVLVIGRWCGWWILPGVDTLPAETQRLVWLVVTFYFGGRALTKDVPAAIGYIWNVVQGKKP